MTHTTRAIGNVIDIYMIVEAGVVWNEAGKLVAAQKVFMDGSYRPWR